MNIICLSASNIEPAREHSASMRMCELIREIISASHADTTVEILPMIDYEVKPCRMCGKCFGSSRCMRDEAFNQVFEKMIKADRLFIVCPQYATLPAKLVILLEKFQEIAYLHWCSDNSYKFPLAGKRVGLIVHGGQTEESVPTYKQTLLAPLASILGSVGMQVVGLDGENPNGIAFGITHLEKPIDSIFVKIDHDWGSIRRRIEPLVAKLYSA